MSDCCSCHINPPCNWCLDHCFECKELQEDCTCDQELYEMVTKNQKDPVFAMGYMAFKANFDRESNPMPRELDRDIWFSGFDLAASGEPYLGNEIEVVQYEGGTQIKVINSQMTLKEYGDRAWTLAKYPHKGVKRDLSYSWT